MRVRVLAAGALGGGAHLELEVGAGQQTLRWLATAACARLAARRGAGRRGRGARAPLRVGRGGTAVCEPPRSTQRRRRRGRAGEPPGRYVPQGVLAGDGAALDVDTVLSEVAGDGDELAVELGDGPLAFTTRCGGRATHAGAAAGQKQQQRGLQQCHRRRRRRSWEGRPRSPPPLACADGPPPTPSAWLEELDLAAEGLAGLEEPGGDGAGLARVREVLLQHAGALQALFLLSACDGAGTLDAAHRLSLPQLKAFLLAAKATGAALPPERLDEVVAAVQAAPGALARKGGGSAPGGARLDLADFMLTLVAVAHMRFEAESFAAGGGGGGGAPLVAKLLSLLQDCVAPNIFPDLARRLEKLRGALTPPALALLRKGRRLTQAALERCQVRRVRAPKLEVDARHVARHLTRWGLLGGGELSPAELAAAVVFAKHAPPGGGAADPARFVLCAQPLALDVAEFERLLAGVALLQARRRKRCYEEVLGELLDGLYRRAGVLPPPSGSGAPPAPAAAAALDNAPAGRGMQLFPHAPDDAEADGLEGLTFVPMVFTTTRAAGLAAPARPALAFEAGAGCWWDAPPPAVVGVGPPAGGSGDGGAPAPCRALETQQSWPRVASAPARPSASASSDGHELAAGAAGGSGAAKRHSSAPSSAAAAAAAAAAATAQPRRASGARRVRLAPRPASGSLDSLAVLHLELPAAVGALASRHTGQL
ncbi:hypothetical protein HT031_001013 [Scenedesmus sp. PABB004]|nr:hypothetical protein HT031_001013 [Scenedesmus sp. PABB004]